MKIIINHLTRMRKGYICVVGVDIETGQHIRPELATSQLPIRLLARNGGPFDMGNVVDLGKTKHLPNKPHVEDHVFTESNVKVIKTLTADRFWRLLTKLAKPKLLEIFGDDLTQRGSQSCAVDLGNGKASIGCLIPGLYPRLYIKSDPAKGKKIRIMISDCDFCRLDLGVTDIRLYENDYVTPKVKLVDRIAKQIKNTNEIILGVGLARPWPDKECWLQANNLHLRDNPVWQLG